MKKVFKIVGILILVLLSLILLLIGFAEFFEDKITNVALKKIRKTIDAPLAIEDISFSLIKEFPLATLELKGVWLGHETTPDSALDRLPKIDTLVRIDQTNLSLYLLPLIDGQYELNEVAVNGAVVNYQVDSIGISNFDFLIPSGTPEENDASVAAYSLLLDRLMLENVKCHYQDNSLKAAANIFVPRINVEGSITNEAIDISSEGIVRLTDCAFDSTNLALMNLTEVSYKLEYANDVVDIKELSIDTDGALLSANGKVGLGDTLLTDINLVGSNLRLVELIKYAPSEILEEAGLVKLAGQVNLAGTVKGFVGDSILPQVDVQFELDKGLVHTVEYPAIGNINVSGELSNGALQNNQTTSLSIDAFHLETEESRINGRISLRNLDRINYRISTQADVNIHEFQKYVPDSLVQQVHGNVQLNLTTSGIVPDSINDAFIISVLANSVVDLSLNQVQVQVDSTLSIDSLAGRMTYQSNYISASDIQVEVPAYHFTLNNASMGVGFTGDLSRMETLELNVDSFLFQMPQSRVEGTAWVKNLSYPNYKLDSEMHFNLDELSEMVPDTLVKKMTGIVNASIKSAGKIHLDSIVDHITQLAMNQSDIRLDVQNVHVEMPDTLMNVRELSGQVSLSNDSISVEALKGNYSGVSFDIDSTKIVNVYGAVFAESTEPLKVEGVFNFGDIDYAMFESFMQEDSLSADAVVDVDNEETINSIPKFIAKGTVFVNSFKYNKALFTNLSALYNMSDSLYIVDQIKFDAFGGQTNSSVKVQILPEDKMKINFKNKTKNLDINQLLVDFDNFSAYTKEEYISYKQLSGTFSTENLNGQVIFIGDSIDIDNILISADLKLDNGRLTQHPIAVEMGKAYGVDGLDDLIFETLDTEIFVLNSKVYAPLTNIKTNTFDISLFGMQNFNLDCQYHLRFYLKEILRKGKTKRIEKKQADESKHIDKYGGTKGLSSLYAIYKVENGETVKSDLERKDSDLRNEMRRTVNVEKSRLRLVFYPKRVKFETNVKDKSQGLIHVKDN